MGFCFFGAKVAELGRKEDSERKEYSCCTELVKRRPAPRGAGKKRENLIVRDQ